MKILLSLLLVISTSVTYGQVSLIGATAKGFVFDINTLLVIFAAFLLLPLWILSKTFIAAARKYYSDKIKARSARVLLPLSLLWLSTAVQAQGSAVNATPGLSNNAMTILLLCVIGVEVLLILFFAQKTNDFIQKIGTKETTPVPPRDTLQWLKDKWTEMNFKPVHEEHALDTGHNYDGIRELDNVVPPWFTTAFIITILFGIGYMYRYHIAKSAPLQIEEYENAVALAELKHDEYLQRQANSIDETNVEIMTGADLDAGEKVFVMLCVACHKADGGGSVGPNLTDAYWIHGGSLVDIFKVVKYGVPDKGMISWREQLSPLQMAQVSNYILTLVGTDPPDAKEKQGELYVPDPVELDTTTVDPLTE